MRSYTPSCDQARPRVSCPGCRPTFAHICLSNHSCPGKQATGAMPGPTPRLKGPHKLTCCQVSQNWWQWGAHYSYPTSVHYLVGCWRGKGKKNPPNQYRPLQECALEQTEAKINHSNTICNSVYKYAWRLNLSSFWLLTCPVLLCHPHKNVFY